MKQSLLRLALGLGLALAALSACGPRPAPSPAPPVEKIPTGKLPDLGGRTVTVAVENGYLPFNYVRPDNGEAEGWDYDALREMGRRLNFQPDFRVVTWDAMIQAVSLGQFDLAANGITITAERAEVVDFSPPYMQVRQRLLVRKDEARFKTLEEFSRSSDKPRIGSQKGNTNYTKAVDLVGQGRVVAFTAFPDAVQALLAGNVDAIVIDDIGGQGYVGAHRGKLRLLEGGLPGEDLGLVFTKGSPLRPAVNAALAEMRADGTLEKLNVKWFGPDFKAPAGVGE